MWHELLEAVRGLVYQPRVVSVRPAHIILLSERGKGPRGSMAGYSTEAWRAIQDADLVIDADGLVIKDRFGEVNREATEAEIRVARTV